MKIGIMTHWNCQENYGQQLQAFALQRLLKERGHHSFLIRYFPVSTWKRRVKRVLFKPSLILERLKRSGAKPGGRTAIREERDFEAFKEKYITSTTVTFKSYAQLVQSVEIIADAYICGSDQVWNENFVMHDENGKPWFLDFGPDDAKRIAYAPSFGANTLSKSYLNYISPMLKRFDAVSVRESTGVDLCRQAGYADAVHVLDPTLLLDKESYLKLFPQEEQKLNIEEPYAFFYFLKTKDTDIPYNAMIETCEAMGLKIIAATVYNDIDELKPYTIQPTIPEWLRLVENAGMVFTNSFHGTAFSLIMNSDFIVFPRKKGSPGMNTRIESLLDSCGIKERMCSDGDALARIHSQKIDWCLVSLKLSRLKTNSIQFIGSSGL